jgi:hypothetical protein
MNELLELQFGWDGRCGRRSALLLGFYRRDEVQLDHSKDDIRSVSCQIRVEIILRRRMLPAAVVFKSGCWCPLLRS